MRTRMRLRAVGAMTALALGGFSQASCHRGSAEPAMIDLSGAVTDTVLRVSDDRSTIVSVAGAEGVLAALSDTTPFVELTGTDGGPVRFGAAGDGPGELRFPSSLALLGDSLAVWDPSSARLSIFDRAGKLLGVRSTPIAPGKIAGRLLTDGYGDAGRLAATPRGLVIATYAGVVRQPAGLWSLALVRLRLDGALDTIQLGSAPVEQLRSLNQDAQELVAVPLWASCGAQGLAAFDPAGSVLRRYTTDGTPVRSDPLEGGATPLTDDLIRVNLRYQLAALIPGKRPEAAVFDQMVESMFEQSRSPKSMFPTNAPAFVAMQCDESGTVWLQQFSLVDAGSGMGRTWTLVDPAGTVRTVRLPPDLRVRAIAGGAIWGVRPGEDGHLFLVKLVVPGP